MTPPYPWLPLFVIVALATPTKAVGVVEGPGHLRRVQTTQQHAHDNVIDTQRRKPLENGAVLAGNHITATNNQRSLRAEQDLKGDELDSFLDRVLADQVGSYPATDAPDPSTTATDPPTESPVSPPTAGDAPTASPVLYPMTDAPDPTMTTTDPPTESPVSPPTAGDTPTASPVLYPMTDAPDPTMTTTDPPTESPVSPPTAGDAPTASPVAPPTAGEGTSKQPAWPFEESDIPLDPKIIYGELDNGLRYYFMPNNEPPDQVQLRLHVDIGANGEAEDEKGMAHFLEHMAFRATKTFPQGTDMDREFQALGVDFGTHINAYTNFEETVYYLGLPDPEQSTLDLGFAWMRDILDGMELLQDELDIEREVVVSELEARDSVGDRLWRQTLDWMMPEHLLSQRPVIGTKETLRGLTREMFVNFYEQYYVPRRATFAVVGDMTVEQVESMIQEYFSSVADTGNRGREPDYGTVTPGRGLMSKVYVDNEQKSDELYIDAVRNYESVIDTVEKRIKDFHINLANSIVSRRIQDLPTKIGSNITWGSADSWVWYQTFVEPYIYVAPTEGDWRDAMANAEQELRRATLHGFTEAELEEVVANTRNNYEQAVASQNARKSSGLADTINDSVNGRFVVASPEENLRIFELAAEEMTTKTLQEAIREHWDTDDIFLYLYTGELDVTEEEAAEELKDLYLASQQVELAPPEEEDDVTWAYTYFGATGTVVSDTMVEDLDIRQMVLSNGVRVNMKKTDFQDDLIHVVARFGTGVVGQPKERTFLDEFSDYMITWGGLGEHDWRDLDRALAGKTAGSSMGVREGAFRFAGTTNPDDLELQLQLMTAQIADPAYGEEATRWWRDEAPAYLDYFDLTLDGAYYYDMMAWLKGGDKRFLAPTEDEMYAFEGSDVEEWLDPQLYNSYLEISLVGDIDDEATIDALLKTFGAISQREETPPQFTAEDRAIAVPQGSQSKTFTYESKLPQAAKVVVWEIPSLTGEDASLARKLDVLAAIFDYRLFEYTRKELGATYSPSAWSSESQDFDYGYFFTYVEGIAEELELFDEAIMLIANNITTNLIGEEELESTLAPFFANIDEDQRSNSYWLFTVLEESQAKPFHLDWHRDRLEDYSSITVDEINELAQEYLTEERALHISIHPVNGTAVA